MQTKYFTPYNDELDLDKKIKYIKNKYTDSLLDKSLKNIDYTKENCVGDILSSVIIVKLPFPLRTELLEQKKKECDSVSEFVQTYAVPQMVIKLRQGAGRLIRSETDTGVIAILDSRAAKGNGHRHRVLKALSKYPLVKTIEELETFIRSVKPDEYWQSDHNTTEGE